MGNGRTATATADALRGTVTVDVVDDLDIATTPALRRAVEDVLLHRPQTVVLDLTRCGFVGVDALGLLVRLTATARRQGTTLTLMGLSDAVRDTIGALELDGALRYTTPEPRGST